MSIQFFTLPIVPLSGISLGSTGAIQRHLCTYISDPHWNAGGHHRCRLQSIIDDFSALRACRYNESLVIFSADDELARSASRVPVLIEFQSAPGDQGNRGGGVGRGLGVGVALGVPVGLGVGVAVAVGVGLAVGVGV